MFFVGSGLQAPLSDLMIKQLDALVVSKIKAVEKCSSTQEKLKKINYFIGELLPALSSCSSSRQSKDPHNYEKVEYILGRLREFQRYFQDLQKAELERERYAEGGFYFSPRRRGASSGAGYFDVTNSERMDAYNSSNETRSLEVAEASRGMRLNFSELEAWVEHLAVEIQSIEKEIWKASEDPRLHDALTQEHKRLVAEWLKQSRELEIWRSHKEASCHSEK